MFGRSQSANRGAPEHSGSVTLAGESPKILLVTHYFPAHRGGVELVAEQVARRLARAGFAIEWYSSATDPPPIEEHGLRMRPIGASNLVEQTFKLPYPIWSPIALPRLWHSIAGAHMVHLHDFIYCGNLLAFLMAKFQRKPVLITQHIGFIPYDSLVARTILRSINALLGAPILGYADQVVFISEAVKRYFTRKTRFSTPPLLIANGVDDGVFSDVSSAKREQLRSSLGLKVDDFVLLFVGRFVEKKGLPLLQLLASNLTDAKWLFAGSGPLDPESWQLENVSVFRDRHASSLADLYRCADLLVLPSKGEGFPLVVQESMSCGTPVLVASETVAGYPAIAPITFMEDLEGKDVLIKWVDRITQLASERGKLSELRADVAQFAREHWSWSHCAMHYAELITALVSARSPHREETQSKL